MHIVIKYIWSIMEPYYLKIKKSIGLYYDLHSSLRIVVDHSGNLKLICDVIIYFLIFLALIPGAHYTFS